MTSKSPSPSAVLTPQGGRTKSHSGRRRTLGRVVLTTSGPALVWKQPRVSGPDAFKVCYKSEAEAKLGEADAWLCVMDDETKELKAKLAATDANYMLLFKQRDELFQKLAAAEKDITDQSYTISHKNDRIAELESALRQQCDECDHDTDDELCAKCKWYHIEPSGDGKDGPALGYDRVHEGERPTPSPVSETPDGSKELLSLDESIALLQIVSQNCKQGKYSTEDSRDISTVMNSLKVHARQIYECCT